MSQHHKQMDKILEDLAQFEQKHLWWTDKRFLDMTNKEGKKAVEQIYEGVEANEFVNRLAANGTDMEIVAFANKVKKISPRMILFVLTCFLDLIHKREEAGQEISHEIVKWYRYEGWRFPLFEYEKRDMATIS